MANTEVITIPGFDIPELSAALKTRALEVIAERTGYGQSDHARSVEEHASDYLLGLVMAWIGSAEASTARDTKRQEFKDKAAALIESRKGPKNPSVKV